MTMAHGGNLRELAERAGLDRDQILDFSASINPLGPPEGLRAVLSRNVDRLVHYPDPGCTELAELLARRHQVTADQIVIGNGSTEICFALARALPFDRAVIPVPSYADYATAVRAAATGWAAVYCRPEAKTGMAVQLPPQRAISCRSRKAMPLPSTSRRWKRSLRARSLCCWANRTIRRARRWTTGHCSPWPSGIRPPCSWSTRPLPISWPATSRWPGGHRRI